MMSARTNGNDATHNRTFSEAEPLLQPSNIPAMYDAVLGTEAVNAGGPQQSSEISQKSSLDLLKVVIPLSIGVFLAAMDGTIIISSYAAIGNDFNQLQNTSWIATGYMLTLASFQPLYGKLSDIFGRKHCLLFAYVVFALGSLLCGFARTMTELIVSRAIAGVGGGGMTTVVSIIMSDIVPLRSRGTWQGIINIVFTTGSAVGAPLGGCLADSIGWRWAFFIQVPIVLFAFCTVSLSLKTPTSQSSNSSQNMRTKLKRVDFLGSLTLIVTVFCLLFALDSGGDTSWSSLPTLVALAVFGISFITFTTIEFVPLSKEPLAPKRIILNSALTPSLLCNFFGVSGAMCAIFNISLYLQAVLGMEPHRAGLYILPSVAGGLAGSLGGGLIIQATGDFYWITVAGYLTFLCGSILLLCMTGLVLQSLPGLVIGFAVSSLGNGAGITTSLISLIANAGPEDQAIATAASYLFRSCGSVLGLSIGSTIIQGTLRTELRQRLAGSDVSDIDYIILRVRESLSYISTLDPDTQLHVLSSYEHAIVRTFWFSLLMAIIAAVCSLFVKKLDLKAKTRT